jgi:iron-regulated transporter 1
MRRIDLFCKLVGPLTIALIDGISTSSAILSTLAMTLASVLVEYLAIARVYRQVHDLHLRPVPSQDSEPTDEPSFMPAMIRHTRHTLHNITAYIRHPAFLPSFSLSLLYLTVLTFGGQMVTYLLSVGYSSISIGLARTIATIFELSSTWLAPKAMQRIGTIRCGIWFLNWQIVWVVFAVAMLWIDLPPTYAIIGLLAGTIASRVGLWGFDLSAQVIIQEVRRSCFAVLVNTDGKSDRQSNPTNVDLSLRWKLQFRVVSSFFRLHLQQSSLVPINSRSLLLSVQAPSSWPA